MNRQNDKTITDYLDVLRRRKGQIFLIMVPLLLGSVILALTLPPVYRSTATILIEGQEVPPDMIRSTVTSYASQRIETIKQRVMTSTNLQAIIGKYNLYAQDRGRKPVEKILGEMRDNITLELVSANVIDPRSNRPTEATIAFHISFEDQTADAAQQVTNELVSLFLRENIKTRTEKAAETSDFLAAEAEKLNRKITRQEARLAAFKEKNIGRLPEQSQLNMQLMERTETGLRDTENQIRTLKDRQFYLEGQLAQITPTLPSLTNDGKRIMSPHERLRILQNEYVNASASYAPDHPDLIRMRREIEALKKEYGLNEVVAQQQEDLKRARNELALAREKYSEHHPDVVRLQKKVAALGNSLKNSPIPAGNTQLTDPDEANNPSYITLKAQLESVKSQLESMRHQRRQLKEKLETYVQRLEQTPQIEREYLTLTRDYQNTLQRYHEITAKQMAAQVAQELEKESKGERFTLIEPPQLPQVPIKPNRVAIVFLGVVLSFGGGLGSAAVAESMNRSVHGVRDLTAVLKAPPLAVIPYIKTTADISRHRKKWLLISIVLLAILMMSLYLVHTFWMPLDVLWFAVMRKYGEMVDRLFP